MLNGLAPCVGRHGTNTPEVQMKALAGQMRNVGVIGWDVAEAVFRARTLPAFAETTARFLPNWTLLSPDCFGALVSLTFNRGPSFNRDGDRYAEMRAIKAAMAARQFPRIGGLIRAMKRIWIGSAIEQEMLRRRENEALLFDGGLATVMSDEWTPPPADEDSGLGNEADGWVEVTEEDAVAAAEGRLPLFDEGAGATRPSWARDDRSADYAHLRLPPVEAAFQLTAADLELLATLNDFPVADDATPILFGLRGCGIVSTQGAITLKDQRPDHITPRCVIGVWDRAGGKVSVFRASTVPDRRAVLKWKTSRSAGNLLATGLYGYIVGEHATVGRDGRLNARPGCFLLRTDPGTKREVIVRRSADDLSYELSDIVDRSRPGDNIHPTFFTEPVDFSSFGCQTVVGFADNGGNHRGPWADFRRAAGMTDARGTPGKAYRYMLLTGAEARLAAELRRAGLAADPQACRSLRRLRFGSKSEAVRRLQIGLRLANPDTGFGPNTAAALYAFQQGLTPRKDADGIYTPEMDARLGFGVFSAMGL